MSRLNVGFNRRKLIGERIRIPGIPPAIQPFTKGQEYIIKNFIHEIFVRSEPPHVKEDDAYNI
jgi:hypothetical protein